VRSSTNEEEKVQLVNKSFSPDGDGYEDVLLIRFLPEKPGYLATVKIYDAEGFLVRDLVDNFLLGTDNTVKWDGVNNEGSLTKTGMYIVQSRLFHPDGQTINSRKVAVLAVRL
jgi:flagellar hook assembly protein FlgD